MEKSDEGYIKFQANWTKQKVDLVPGLLVKFNQARHKLKEREWLGILPDGVGFGNVSHRMDDHQFLITASGTGAITVLNEEHLSLVIDVNIDQNELKCIGGQVASSESMSHAVFYSCRPKINAVIHIHCRELWLKYFKIKPTSDANATYGTPEMARSILTILKSLKSDSGILIMGGHADGIIAFGTSFEEAMLQLEKL